jgi:nicotinate-nucleotide adenylyltransferase
MGRPPVPRLPSVTGPLAADEGPVRRPPRGGRLGIFGGTFDPPHIAHVVAATWTREALGLDEVWLVPAHRPWQKVGDRPVSDIADRLAMVRAAALGVPGLHVSTMEIDRGGNSYTADTLAELAASDPKGHRFLIVGGDAAAGIPTWERVDEVRRGCTLVIVDRPGIPSAGPPPGWTFERVSIPRLDVASTDLRRRVAGGLPIDGLVPPAVCAVVSERRLYRGPLV